MLNRTSSRLQDGTHPCGQTRMNAVMDPQALAPIRHQTELAQVGQMSRDVRLRRADGMRQLAHAKLFVPQEQHQTAQAGVMG